MNKKITKVQKQKNTRNRYSIYLDEVYAFGVDENILVKYGLLKGKELDENFIENIIMAEMQNKANNYALNLLSYRARSKKELIDKLKEKEYDDDIIHKTIGYLEDNGYIDDREFAFIYAKEKIKSKKYGKKRIEYELYRKGIDKYIIDEILDGTVDFEGEYERALEIGSKKVKTTYKNDDKQAQYRKLGNFLQRKGYNYDIIKKVLKELL